MADQGERVTFAELMRRGTLEIGDGYRAKNSELGGDGPIFMRAGRLTQSGWDWDGAERFQAELATKVEPKIAKPRDTVITTKGNSTGRTGYVPDDAPIFVYSPHLSYWRSVNPGELDARYLRYFALSPEFRSQLKAMAHGTDMAPYLSLSDQKRIELVLPGMERQQAISEVLGALDDKIAVNERIAVTYEQLLKLQVERMGLEVEPGPEEAVLVTEFVHFNPKVPKASPEAVYVDMAALSTNRAGISAWARREPKGGTRFVNGDTLLARITPCLENGKTGYVGFMEDGEIGVGSTEFIVMRSVRGIPPEFSYFLARSKRFREHAIR
ncbi:restriction endonuclease subunit S, partial [Streptomyces sp. NPDC002172]